MRPRRAPTAKATRGSPLEFRLFHGLTPETDTSCFYFWSAANGFRQDEPAATEQFFDQVAAAFLEDKTVVEGQQPRLTELGETALVDIATDAARLHMRRTVERLLAEEARVESGGGVASRSRGTPTAATLTLTTPVPAVKTITYQNCAAAELPLAVVLGGN